MNEIEVRIPKQQLESVESYRKNLIAEANGIEVTSQEKADQANATAIRLNAGLKQMEKKRKELGKPFRDGLDKLNSFFKQLESPVRDALNRIDHQIKSWRAELTRQEEEAERKRQAEIERRKKIQDAHAAKGHETKEDITPVPETASLIQQDTTKIRKQWDFEIIDERSVPDDYKVIDTAKIRKAIFSARDKEGIPQIEIPGVNIFQKEVPIYA